MPIGSELRVRRVKTSWAYASCPPFTVVAVCLLAGLLALGQIAIVAAAPTFPELTGRVVDLANLLDPQAEASLSADLAALETKSSDQIVVVTLPSLQGYAIEDFGYQLGRHWGIGQKGKDNGALLIVAPSERKVRIEVGYGLEPHLTDAMSTLIIQNAILPRFRQGDFQGGILAGVRDMTDVVTGDADAVKQRAKGMRRGDEMDNKQLIFLAIWLAIFAFVIYVQFQQARQGAWGGRRRRGRDGGVIVIPGNSGGWSGSRGGFGGGGGGFSGGGGGFGGGGSSGGW